MVVEVLDQCVAETVCVRAHKYKSAPEIGTPPRQRNADHVPGGHNAARRPAAATGPGPPDRARARAGWAHGQIALTEDPKICVPVPGCFDL